QPGSDTAVCIHRQDNAPYTFNWHNLSFTQPTPEHVIIGQNMHLSRHTRNTEVVEPPLPSKEIAEHYLLYC
ncbi:MAG: hypothetical protein U0K35_03805, partial [Prevotella sp.]|nr:hypothetical protein [Prevotella sp.]